MRVEEADGELVIRVPVPALRDPAIAFGAIVQGVQGAVAVAVAEDNGRKTWDDPRRIR